LSIGFGWAAVAAGRATRDAEVGAVQAAVAAAHNALGRCLEMLPPSLGTASVNADLMQPPQPVSALTWRTMLGTRPQGDQLAALLDSALDETSRAAAAVRSNALGQTVLTEIVSAQAALARVYARLADANLST
jgi:hypothetical protein